MERVTKICSLCYKEKTLNKSSWYANNECSVCRAKTRQNILSKCTICNVEFIARTRKQKCCGELCRSEYNKEDRRLRASIARLNIETRIAENLRSRISRAIRRNLKGGSAVDDLGCSIEELKEHLESQFQEGMAWDNYGKWHIDHINALVKFDLTDEQQFKKAAHYSNLQPLWAKDNISKGGK
jgi:hypothetical protein